MYSTVEGLLDKVHTQLQADNPFKVGDSANSIKFNEFLTKLAKLKEGNTPFTLILDDPLANCFMYNPFSPEADPQLIVEDYERTEEQNDDLGISDMNV
jgi:zinc finger protein